MESGHSTLKTSRVLFWVASFVFVAAVFYPVGYLASFEEVQVEKTKGTIMKPELTGLSPNVRELKQAFNEAKGDVRMILLLSPG